MIVVEVKVNHKLIAMYGIQRVLDGPEPEKLNTYAVGRHYPDTAPAREADRPELQHRYDDPVERLVSRALALADETFGPAPRIP